MSVVIAGGGLAGAAAAILLARAGEAVTLLERDAGPRDKVCGEFLSREALAYLAGLGIDVAALGASAISAMRLVHGATVIESRLPFQGAGLSRRVLDEAMLQRADAAGASVRRGAAVRSIAADGVTVEGEHLAARTVFLATGKHDVRSSPRLPAHPPEPLIGFKMHFALAATPTAALRGHVEIILFDRGYAGLQLIEGDVANLCLLIDRARYDEAGQDWPALLAALERSSPYLARRLDGATPLLDRPLTIFRVPYGFVHQAPGPPGLFRLGDQAAVIPSFCGDGMSIALHSAHRAVQVLREGGDAARYHQYMRRDVGGSVRLAFGLYRLCRTPAMRRVVLTACSAWPGLMRVVAQRTRVRETAPPHRLPTDTRLLEAPGRDGPYGRLSQ